MYKHIVYTLFIAVFIIGCEKPPPPEELPPPPPPPPTARELSDKVIEDMKLNTATPAATSIVSPAVVEKMKAQLKKNRSSISTEENGEDALALIRHKIDTRISACEDAKSWSQVLAMVELHLILKPGSQKHIVVQDRAIVQLKKPVVTVKGFLTDGKTKRKKALLDFFMPLENITYSERMIVGEQLHGLKFEKIIGNDLGIIFFYEDADERFEVFMASAAK